MSGNGGHRWRSSPHGVAVKEIIITAPAFGYNTIGYDTIRMYNRRVNLYSVFAADVHNQPAVRPFRYAN
jgi:hypothetical protein